MMIVEIDCPSCQQHAFTADWDTYDTRVVCPVCGEAYTIAYDASYDEATGDEDGWFYLEPAPV
jgi:uncharacterized Zn finger protein (UPF0148 family)